MSRVAVSAANPNEISVGCTQMLGFALLTTNLRVGPLAVQLIQNAHSSKTATTRRFSSIRML